VVFLATIAFLLFLISRFGSAPQQISNRFGSSSERELRQVIDALRSRSPEAADKLQQLEDIRDRRAIESLLRTEKDRRGTPVKLGNDLANCLMNSKDNSSTKARLELVRNAYNPNLVSNAEDRNSFLYANGFLIDALDEIGSQSNQPLTDTYQQYLSDLATLASNPEEYQRVMDDPIGVMLYKQVKDKEIRDYYHSTREYKQNPDWLLDVIAQCIRRDDDQPGISTADSEKDQKQSKPDQELDDCVTVGDVVRVAYENHPTFQQMIFDDLVLNPTARRPVPLVVAIFQDYGQLIRIATDTTYQLPRSDLLDVIFANADYVDQWLENKGKTDDSLQKLAAHFTFLYQSKRAVWNEAKYSALALQLQEQSPQYADKVLEEYGADDIATLIFCGYEDSIPQATKAVAQYGDLAIAILQMYADDKQGAESRFHDALKNPQIGTRIVPYVAAKGDEGLEALDRDIRWVDKYLDNEGNLKGPDVLESIPMVGAPAKIVKNMVNNHPNSWEEIGWAAVDIADVALTIGTFGSSKLAMGAAKSTAKQAAKTKIIQSGKAITKGSARQAAKSARKSIGKTLLRRTANQSSKTILANGIPIANRAWKAVRYIDAVMYARVNDIARIAGKLKKSWGSLPPALRKAAYSGLLAATVYLRIVNKSIPIIAESLKRLADFATHSLENSITPFTETLGGVINEVLRPDSAILGWLFYLTALAVLVGIAWKLTPWKRKPLAYA
jgi:hypothetical protein